MKLFDDDLYDGDDPRRFLEIIERSGAQYIARLDRTGLHWLDLVALAAAGQITLDDEYARLADAGRDELARARAAQTEAAK